MRILLDTCTFLWALHEPERLSPDITKAFANPKTARLLSSVSVWEIAVKHRLGRFGFPEPPTIFIPRAMQHLRLDPLPLDMNAALLVECLPGHHKDPFDRMLRDRGTQYLSLEIGRSGDTILIS